MIPKSLDEHLQANQSGPNTRLPVKSHQHVLISFSFLVVVRCAHLCRRQYGVAGFSTACVRCLLCMHVRGVEPMGIKANPCQIWSARSTKASGRARNPIICSLMCIALVFSYPTICFASQADKEGLKVEAIYWLPLLATPLKSTLHLAQKGHKPSPWLPFAPPATASPLIVSLSSHALSFTAIHSPRKLSTVTTTPSPRWSRRRTQGATCANSSFAFSRARLVAAPL